MKINGAVRFEVERVEAWIASQRFEPGMVRTKKAKKTAEAK